MTKVAVLVGSLRKESYSRKVANNVMKMFPQGYELELVSIDLELYNQDLDTKDNLPKSWQTFRDKLRDMDAVLFVTPEYNRSVPGVLKNALDVGSRPPTESVWKGKPAGIISNSPKNLGGFGANHHLRQSLVFFDMPVVEQPEIYLNDVTTVLDDSGAFNNTRTKKYLQGFVDKFVTLIERYQ